MTINDSDWSIVPNHVFWEDGDDNFSETVALTTSVLPVTFIGQPLNKKQLKDVQELFCKLITDEENPYMYCHVSDAVADLVYKAPYGKNKNTKGKAKSILNKLLAKACKDNPDKSISISNITKGLTITLSAEGIKSNYGDEYDAVFECLYGRGDGYVETDLNGSFKKEVVEPLALELKRQIPSVHLFDCFYDNLRKWKLIENHGVMGDRFIYEAIEHVSSFKELMNRLQIVQCHNAYIIQEDRSGCDSEPLLFVGFNKEGRQVFNITFFPLCELPFQNELDNYQHFFKKIRQHLSGELLYYDDEVCNHWLDLMFDEEGQRLGLGQKTRALDMTVEEDAFKSMYFSDNQQALADLISRI